MIILRWAMALSLMFMLSSYSFARNSANKKNQSEWAEFNPGIDPSSEIVLPQETFDQLYDSLKDGGVVNLLQAMHEAAEIDLHSLASFAPPYPTPTGWLKPMSNQSSIDTNNWISKMHPLWFEEELDWIVVNEPTDFVDNKAFSEDTDILYDHRRAFAIFGNLGFDDRDYTSFSMCSYNPGIAVQLIRGSDAVPMFQTIYNDQGFLIGQNTFAWRTVTLPNLTHSQISHRVTFGMIPYPHAWFQPTRYLLLVKQNSTPEEQETQNCLDEYYR